MLPDNKQNNFIHTHALQPTFKTGKYREEVPSGTSDGSFKPYSKMIGQKRGVDIDGGDMEIIRINKNAKSRRRYSLSWCA